MRDIVREVAGLAPYERRVVELLKVGKDKRALKVAKKKVRSAVSVLIKSSGGQRQAGVAVLASIEVYVHGTAIHGCEARFGAGPASHNHQLAVVLLLLLLPPSPSVHMHLICL